MSIQDPEAPEFIIHKLPRPQCGQMLLAHDIGIEALEALANSGIRFSQDDDPTDALEVYKAIQKPELQNLQFACTTAHIADTFKARSITALYGRGSNITLIIDVHAASKDLLIFNGDIGRLGKALKSGDIQPAFIKTFVLSGSVHDLAATLLSLYQNTCRNPPIEPRLHGNSFEARLFNGISPSHIAQICIGNQDDKRAVVAAKRIERLRE